MIKIYISGENCGENQTISMFSYFLVKNQIEAQIYQNISIIEKYGVYDKEPGLKIHLLSILPETFIQIVYPYIEKIFSINCSYIKYDGKIIDENDVVKEIDDMYEGCINKWDKYSKYTKYKSPVQLSGTE